MNLRLSTRLSNGSEGADSERESGDLVAEGGLGASRTGESPHAQTSSDSHPVISPVAETEAVTQAVKFEFENGMVACLHFGRLRWHTTGWADPDSTPFRFDEDGGVSVLLPVRRIWR